MKEARKEGTERGRKDGRNVGNLARKNERSERRKRDTRNRQVEGGEGRGLAGKRELVEVGKNKDEGDVKPQLDSYIK